MFQKILTKLFHQFLSLPNGAIRYKVTWKRVTRGSVYRYEMFSDYKLLSPGKATSWIKKNYAKVTTNS